MLAAATGGELHTWLRASSPMGLAEATARRATRATEVVDFIFVKIVGALLSIWSWIRGRY